jgi:hypothetical protein
VPARLVFTVDSRSPAVVYGGNYGRVGPVAAERSPPYRESTPPARSYYKRVRGGLKGKMEYRKLVWMNPGAIADYLGIDRLELCGGPVRHRACPNCVTFDHSQGHLAFLPDVLMSSEIIELTSKTCGRVFWTRRPQMSVSARAVHTHRAKPYATSPSDSR